MDDLKDLRKKPGRKPLDVDFTPEELIEYKEYVHELARQVRLTETDIAIDEDLIRLTYVMVDPRAGQTIADWCRIADCDRLKYYRNRENPKFIKFIQRVIKERRNVQTRVKAHRSMEALIDGHNMKAIRLFYELEGELIHRSENTNVTETHEQRMKRLKDKVRDKGK